MESYVAASGGIQQGAWLLVALPLLGAAVLLLGGRRTDRWGHWLAVGLSWAAFVWGALLFLDLRGHSADTPVTPDDEATQRHDPPPEHDPPPDAEPTPTPVKNSRPPAGGTPCGEVGTVTTEFFKAPRFGGFREQMAYPLLVDMAIHQFDLARDLIQAEAVPHA